MVIKPKIVINVGDTINTNHGKGTVVGFERFTPDGNTAPMGYHLRYEERTLVKLHKGHTWLYDDDRLYGMFYHDLVKLNPKHPVVFLGIGSTGDIE